VIIRKEHDDYQKEAQPVNVSSEVAGPCLSNIHVPNAVHKDMESLCKSASDGKQSIQQEAFVGVKKLLQQQESICDTEVIVLLASLDESLEQKSDENIYSSRRKVTGFVLDMVECYEQPTCGKIKPVACQLLDQCSLMVQKVKREKGLKCWKFKFKPEKEDIKQQNKQVFFVLVFSSDIWFLHHEEKLNDQGFNSGSRRITPCVLFRTDLQEIQSGMLPWRMQKQKYPKSWKFKFKSSSEDCKLKRGEFWNLHDKNRMRLRVLQSCLRLLKDSGDDEAESSPVLNFAAKHTLLWLQNYSEEMHIVSERGRNKKRICSKTWMFKSKAPLKRIHDKLGKSKDCDALLMVIHLFYERGRFTMHFSVILEEWKHGLEIYGYEYKKQMLLLFNQLKRVWESGRLRAPHFVGDFQETPWFFTDESKDIQKFQVLRRCKLLVLIMKRWDVNNRVWDPGGFIFRDFSFKLKLQ